MKDWGAWLNDLLGHPFGGERAPPPGGASSQAEWEEMKKRAEGMGLSTSRMKTLMGCTELTDEAFWFGVWSSALVVFVTTEPEGQKAAAQAGELAKTAGKLL